MATTTSSATRPADREALRRELLKLIVKNEATRRDQAKAPTQ
jgi:hypothetical protein